MPLCSTVWRRPERSARRTPLLSAVYRAALDWCDTAYITKIHASFEADAWFPDLDALPEWELAEEEPVLEDRGLTFHYATYRRKG